MPKREVLRGPNIPEHAQPFPPAVKIGNMVYSAAVGGDDPSMGEETEEHRDQPGEGAAEQQRGHERPDGQLAGGKALHGRRVGRRVRHGTEV